MRCVEALVISADLIASNDEARMANAEGMTEADASSFDHSSLIRASSFGFRHSAIGNNRRTLNLVSVLSERVSKHLRHTAAVQHDQIRVVRLPFIVLPTFVPPAK